LPTGITASPTPLPTASPTTSPTNTPTNAPTPPPTSAPTTRPTPAPSAAPSPIPVVRLNITSQGNAGFLFASDDPGLVADPSELNPPLLVAVDQLRMYQFYHRAGLENPILFRMDDAADALSEFAWFEVFDEPTLRVAFRSDAPSGRRLQSADPVYNISVNFNQRLDLTPFREGSFAYENQRPGTETWTNTIVALSTLPPTAAMTPSPSAAPTGTSAPTWVPTTSEPTFSPTDAPTRAPVVDNSPTLPPKVDDDGVELTGATLAAIVAVSIVFCCFFVLFQTREKKRRPTGKSMFDSSGNSKNALLDPLPRIRRRRNNPFGPGERMRRSSVGDESERRSSSIDEESKRRSSIDSSIDEGVEETKRDARPQPSAPMMEVVDTTETPLSAPREEEKLQEISAANEDAAPAAVAPVAKEKKKRGVGRFIFFKPNSPRRKRGAVTSEAEDNKVDAPSVASAEEENEANGDVEEQRADQRVDDKDAQTVEDNGGVGSSGTDGEESSGNDGEASGGNNGADSNANDGELSVL